MTKNIPTTRLTEEQQDLIFGTLLGDGNLQTESNGTTWRYRALHGENQLDYIQHKYNVLNNLIQMELASESTRRYFNTRVDNCFKFYANMFYTYDSKTQTWVKDVPQNIEKFLTARALAYLHMDDGALKWEGFSNGMRLCTESFSEVGVNRLKKAIEKLCSIQTTLTRKALSRTSEECRIGYRISIPEKSSAAYRAKIEPYLVPCMRYKVSDGNRGCLS